MQKKKLCKNFSFSLFLFLFDVSFFIRSEESRVLFAESVIYVSIEASLRVL